MRKLWHLSYGVFSEPFGGTFFLHSCPDFWVTSGQLSFVFVNIILVRISLWQVPLAGQISQDWEIGFTGENRSSLYFVLQNSLNMVKHYIFSLKKARFKTHNRFKALSYYGHCDLQTESA